MPHKVYETFFEKGEVVEIRALGLSGKSKSWKGYARDNSVVSGYFDNAKDFSEAARVLDNAKAKGVWFTLNPVVPALLARAKNTLIANPKATTTDDAIEVLRWLPIDLDPNIQAKNRWIKRSEFSSNDEELKHAKDLARAITKWLEEGDLKFAKGIRACSGNGYHIVYRLPDLPNDDEHRELVRRCVEAIAVTFKNEKVEIDLKVFNPARIWKIYGTTGRKGDSTDDRPHRKSYFLPDQPAKLKDAPAESLEQLKKLSVLAPERTTAYPLYPSQLPAKTDQKKGETSPMKYNLGTLDVPAYLNYYEIKIQKVKQEGVLTRYCLAECVFDSNHRNGQASIAVSPDYPWIKYQCFHDSCHDKTWKMARPKISGPDSLKQFCSGYDPDWKAPKEMGTGMLKGIDIKIDDKLDGTILLMENTTVPPPRKIDYSEFFEKKGKRPSFVPRYMANYLLAYLQNIVYTDGTYWRYDKGVWQPFHKDVLKQICVMALKDQIQAHWISNSMDVFTALVNKREQDWPKDKGYINCLNGMVDLEKKVLIPHDPKYWSKVQISSNFDLEAVHNRWDKFLEEIFPEDKKRKSNQLGKAQMLQQFFGYCLLPDCRFQKAIFLYGAGANGKSTALETLIEVIGRGNTSSLTITDLGQRFKTQFLQDKLINIATETNTRDPIATEIFKAAIRGDGITAERKYGEPYLFNPIAKWLIAMNAPPIIPDKTYGFTRSITVLEFKKRFEGAEIDPYLPGKLAEEKDGVFLWALFGLERLLKNRGFDIPPVVKKESDEFMKVLNPVLIFIEEQCQVGSKQKVGSVEIYEEYKKWCHDGMNRPLSRNKFHDQILMNFPSVTKGRIGSEDNQKRGFSGIGLRERIV
jgi:P4 family phage/plasmid primase-like protien